jgi:hypothetical protein
MKFAGLALILGIMFNLSAPNTAFAADCGLPPGDAPTVPDGATATDDQIKAAIREVRDYGTAVQRYLNCMQLKQDDFFLNMNTEQRERWNEDFNALADLLAEIENGLNDQIRIYNRRS